MIREVTPSGIISTYAGNGTQGYSGDGGQAGGASLNLPLGIGFDTSGDLFIADNGNNVIREVSRSGIITTVAGNGTSGFSGDGGPAISAELNNPQDVVANSLGALFIADTSNDVVREVSPSGVISTFAGNGVSGYSGDGGPAINAEFEGPTQLLFDAFGDLVINDNSNEVVREVDVNGIITTLAGTIAGGYSGDGGPAAAANLVDPYALAFNSSGNLAVADAGNNVIRELAASPLFAYTVTPAPTTLSLSVAASPRSTTFNVRIDTPSASLVIGGTVSFYDGTTLLGVAPVVNGVAVFDSAALSPGSHMLSAVFSGTEEAGPSTATQTVTFGGSPSVTGLSRYPVHNNRTLVSLFFDQTLNPAEALWKHNYQLHTSSGGNVKISHIYFDPPSNTVTLLPGHRLALRSTYNLKVLGLNAKSNSKGSSPTVTSSDWLVINFKAKINHKAMSVPEAPPAITFVNGQEVATRG